MAMDIMVGNGTDIADPPAPVFGRVLYYLLCSEIDGAADWYEKAVEQRELFATIFAQAPISRELRESPRWPRLAKLMNRIRPTNPGQV